VCLPRSLQLSVALLAVLKTGAAYLPLDRSCAAAPGLMLRDAGAHIVLERPGRRWRWPMRPSSA
jgi:non-ribosomal peptide synthetase component F